MLKDLGVKPYTFPMLVLMIATYNEDGSVDVMNMAWGGVCAENMVALNIDENHKTAENIKRTGAFTLNGIVFNKYVDATFGVSRDDSVTNSYLAYLKITMTCDMGSKTWTIPVHIEERANCNMYNVEETARGMDLGDYENSTDAQGTIKCPSCGKELDEEAEYCGGCGYVLYCPVCKAEHGNPDAASCECGYEWKVSTPKP